MAYETVTYVNQLSTSAPAGGDDRSTAAEHLRLIKRVLKGSFPNMSGAVAATQLELGMLSGNSLTVRDKLSALSLSTSAFLTDIARLSETVASVQSLATVVLGTILRKTVSICLSATSLQYLVTSLPAGANRITVQIGGLATVDASKSLRLYAYDAGGSFKAGFGSSLHIGGASADATSFHSTSGLIFPTAGASDAGMTTTARIEFQRMESAGTQWFMTLQGACWSSSGAYAMLFASQKYSVSGGTIDKLLLATESDCTGGVVRTWVEN